MPFTGQMVGANQVWLDPSGRGIWQVPPGYDENTSPFNPGNPFYAIPAGEQPFAAAYSGPAVNPFELTPDPVPATLPVSDPALANCPMGICGPSSGIGGVARFTATATPAGPIVTSTPEGQAALSAQFVGGGPQSPWGGTALWPTILTPSFAMEKGFVTPEETVWSAPYPPPMGREIRQYGRLIGWSSHIHVPRNTLGLPSTPPSTPASMPADVVAPPADLHTVNVGGDVPSPKQGSLNPADLGGPGISSVVAAVATVPVVVPGTTAEQTAALQAAHVNAVSHFNWKRFVEGPLGVAFAVLCVAIFLLKGK